ncbi:hypothetical protein R1sor_000228 [Riccia sorocarpa]|uniref:Reverse transcriptase zinc-binding domain-containing protein n=1 Tax=Riccia sorocarpa TaxID=122646 RepID=A0ABD3GU76_9MARC
MTSPPDACWPRLFWGLCRDNICRTKEEFLLLADLQAQPPGPFFRRMCRAWDSLRYSLIWSPPALSIPLSSSVDSALTLLFKGGVISRLEAQDTRWDGFRNLTWAQLLDHAHLDMAPALGPIDQVLRVPTHSGKLARTIGHQDFSCRECGDAVEDVQHAVLSCPGRRRLWVDLADRFPDISTAVRSLTEGEIFPSILSTLLGGPRARTLSLLTVFVLACRACWKCRCQLQFEGHARSLSWGSVLISAAESLLAAAAIAYRIKKQHFKLALEPIMLALPSTADRIREKHAALFP